MVINLINFKSVLGNRELLGVKNQSCPFVNFCTCPFYQKSGRLGLKWGWTPPPPPVTTNT